MRKLLAIGAGLGLAAAPALAATPKDGRYVGRTSQKRAVALRVADSQVKSFSIHWKAACRNKQQFGGDSQRSNLSISKSGRYRGTATDRYSVGHGERAKVFSRVDGRFTSSTRSRGTWKAAVTIYRGKRTVTSCHTGKVTYTVKRTG